MELIEGPSLEVYLTNRAEEGKWPSFEESRKIVEQLLEGLEYAHDKKRVHGDVKPGNIARAQYGLKPLTQIIHLRKMDPQIARARLKRMKLKNGKINAKPKRALKKEPPNR